MAASIDEVLAEISNLSVQGLLVRRAESDPDKPFIHFDRQTVTYGEVHRRAMRNASVLGARSVERGNLVAVMMNNGHEYVQVYAGLAYRGAPVVLVNTAFRGYMLEYVLNDAGCRVLIVDEEFLDVVAESESRLSQLELVTISTFVAILASREPSMRDS